MQIHKGQRFEEATASDLEPVVIEILQASADADGKVEIATVIEDGRLIRPRRIQASSLHLTTHLANGRRRKTGWIPLHLHSATED